MVIVERESLKYQQTFVFALIKEPCQSLSSNSASGNLGLGGWLIYHRRTNEMSRRATVPCTEGDLTTASRRPISSTVVSSILVGK